MNILVIGNNTVDHVWTINGKLKSGEKKSDTDCSVFAGGQAANCATTLAMLGCNVYYIGSFGNDNFGQMCQDSMIEVGIDISWSNIVNCPNHLATVIVDKVSGERSILMYKDKKHDLNNYIIKDEWLDKINLLYIDGHEPSYSFRFIKEAYKKNIPVITDAEDVNPYFLEYLPFVTILIAPIKVFKKLSKKKLIKDNLLEIKKMGPKNLIATNGEYGGYALDEKNNFYTYKSEKCNVVDTTGAGDAFHAGYIVAYKNKLPFRQSIRYAAVVAAKKCEVRGPRIKKDDIYELNIKLEELKNENM